MMADPHLRLIRALLDRSDGAAILVEATATPWASATFDGFSHHLAMRFRRAEADRFCAGIADMPLAIPGHLVATISAVATDACSVRIEAVTLADR